MPRPLIIGHRGASASAPENTLAAFRIAAAAGADGVETDLRVTADGEFILLHDARVDRTTGGRGRVDRLTLASVRELDAGSWFLPRPHSEFAGERIPTLEEALALLAKLRLCLYLEIKARLTDSQLAALAARLRRTRPTVPLVVLAFQASILESLHSLDSRLPTALLADRPRGAVERAERIGAAYLAPSHQRATRGLIRRARDAGLGILVWTVNRPAALRRILPLGIDAIMTDDPARMRGLLESCGSE